MYLHVGQDIVVPFKDIIGIFDIENTTTSKFTRSFLADAEKGKRVVNVSDDLPKAFVVCVESDGSETVYISQISAATLRKRYNGNEIVSNPNGGRT